MWVLPIYANACLNEARLSHWRGFYFYSLVIKLIIPATWFNLLTCRQLKGEIFRKVWIIFRGNWVSLKYQLSRSYVETSLCHIYMWDRHIFYNVRFWHQLHIFALAQTISTFIFASVKASGFYAQMPTLSFSTFQSSVKFIFKIK